MPDDNELRLAQLFKNIQTLLDNVAREKRPCRACGTQLWFILHANGRLAPYTSDGTNHFANCPQAAQFKRKAATKT